MPPLSDCQKREIRQLLAAAEDFFKVATVLWNRHQPRRVYLRSIAERFTVEMPQTGKWRDLNRLNAYLGGVGIRLATINEILDESHITSHYENAPGLTPGTLEDVGLEEVADFLKRRLNEYIPELLRDNVGHMEPEPSDEYFRARRVSPRRKKQWQARRLVISRLTVKQILDAVGSALHKHKKRLGELLS